MQRKAFTLIELLVVIAIIAILAAILFPVFAQAREKARSAVCESNLKQVALALKMYVQDYDEIYPKLYYRALYNTPNAYNYWFMEVNPYIKNKGIFHCPSDPRTPWMPGDQIRDGVWTDNDSLSYVMNYELTGVAEAAVPASADLAMNWDSYCGWCGTWYTPDLQPHGYDRMRPYSSGCYNNGPDNEGCARHSKGENFSFADGHVKWERRGLLRWDNVQAFCIRGGLCDYP